MLVKKKLFKYYAIRINNTVLFRRTTGKLQVVRSKLYKPSTDFSLVQITYTGGQVIGCMSYDKWLQSHDAKLTAPIQLSRSEYRALDPYIYKPKIKGSLSKPRGN